MAYSIRPMNNRSRWEWMVLKESPNALFQSWQWGEVQKKLHENVSRYGVWQGDTLVGVFQTVDVRARRGSFLHLRHGPVLGDQSEELWRFVLSFLRREARARNLLFVRMNPVLPDDPERRMFFRKFGLMPAAIHRMDGEQCWVLDLNIPEEALLAGMRKSSRYEIRRADKEGVTVEKTTDPSRIADFLRLYRETSLRQGFVPHRGIEEEFSVFAASDQAALYFGRHGGSIISGAIILYYGSQAIYHHGASIPSRAPVSHAVQWQAILDAKKRGLNVYNFWGIAPEDNPKHPWRGITVFKKGFGGREVNYIHAMDMPVSVRYIVPRTIETIRRLAKGYD